MILDPCESRRHPSGESREATGEADGLITCISLRIPWVEKARLAKIGKKQSPEHIAKRAAAQRGKKQSPEHAAKSRVAFLGRKHTDEARAKMSAAGRGRKKSPKHIAKIKTAKAAKRAAKLAQQQVNQPPLF